MGLRIEARSAGVDIPVFVGMRNWHPLLPDTLKQMADAGVKRAIGFISAAQRSYSSCTQYKQNVVDARAETVRAGMPDVEVIYVEDWHEHDGFIDANARHVQDALASLPEAVRDRARILFTASQHPGVDDRRGPVSAAVAAVLHPRGRARGPEGLGARVPEPQRAGPKTRGWGLTSAITCARSTPGGCAAVVHLPHWLRLRPYRGAVRPRRARRRMSAANWVCRWRAPRPSMTTLHSSTSWGMWC